VIAWLAGLAHGAACCGGPPVDPVVLGPGERAGVSGGLLGGVTPARWASDGTVHGADDARLTGAIGARLRLAPWAQAGVVVPASVDTVRGPGLDDPSLVLRLEPGVGAMAAWRPTASLALVPPLGRRLPDLPPWWRSSVSLGVERAGHHSGLAAWVLGSAPVWSPDHPLATPGFGWEVGAGGGPRGEWGSVGVAVALRGTTPGRIDGTAVGGGSTRPAVRGTWTLPFSTGLRLITAAEAGPPVPYLGREADAELLVSSTLLVVPHGVVPGAR
jgi:hypothetical protein